MRYLLHESQWKEIHARQQYLFDVFRLYFLPNTLQAGFIPLKSVGKGYSDILFITGHTNYVEAYLGKMVTRIRENVIVITSCMGYSFKKYTKGKEIYVPDPKTPLCLLRDGQPYGFDFDISDAELDMYNSSGTIMERIQSAYKQL